MAKILLSLSALALTRTETHMPTGATFDVAPIASDRDAELRAECTDIMGQLNEQAYLERLLPEVVKGWTGIGDKGDALVCNAENLVRLAKVHGATIGRFIAQRARSLDHYRTLEVEAAKNG